MGGQTQYILNHWKYIDKEKYHFDFVTFAPRLSYENELLKQGCQIYHMSTYAEQDKELFIKEMDSILVNNYDMIHIHTPHWKSLIVEERARIAKIGKIIIHGHCAGLGTMNEVETEAAMRKHYEIRDTINMDMADYFCACSKKAALWLYGDRIPEQSIQILKNAIDVKQFAYNKKLRQKYREEFGVEAKVVIGHIGRYVYQKNHDFIIDFFRRMVDVNENVVLLLIGTGPEKDRITKKAFDKGLQDKVIFLDRRNDIAGLMQLMDIFILPSKYEGFPIVLTEAQAADLPCLVSENVTQECDITGRVEFLPMNIEEWVARANKVIQNGMSRSDKTQYLIENGYNLPEATRQLEAIYDKG